MKNNQNYSPASIANYFLEKMNKLFSPQENINSLKLQALIYIANGWYMACYNEKDETFPLINESFHAWKYNPVCESIYYTFMKFGNNPIPKKCFMKELINTNDPLIFKMIHAEIPEDETVKDLLDFIFAKYAFEDFRLNSEDMNNPWYKAKMQGEKEGIAKGKEIPSHDIRIYFETILNNRWPNSF